MSPRILLLSENAEDREFATLVAKAADRVLETGARVDAEAVARALSENYEILVDAGIAGAIEALSSMDTGALPWERLHLIASPTDKPLLARLMELASLRNLIFRRYPKLQSDAETYARILQSGSLPGPSGLKSVIGTDIQYESVKFIETLEKAFVANVLAYQLGLLNFHELIIPSVTNAVDELLMNAMYDAPVDERGDQIYSKESRRTNFKLAGRQAVEMQLGARDDLIAITVVDQFGSLDPATIFRHLAKTYNGKQNEERSAELAGAGLGLSLILRSGGSLLFSCKQGERTEATVFFRRTEKLREFSRQFQFVSTRTFL